MKAYPFPAQEELTLVIYTVVKELGKKFTFPRMQSVSPGGPLSSSEALLTRFLEVLFILLQLGEAARTACTAWEQTVASGLSLLNSLLCSELLLPASALHP